jgi:hypothetical protein
LCVLCTPGVNQQAPINSTIGVFVHWQVLLGDKVQASPADIKQQAAPYKLTTTKGKEVSC